jgi:hypothetical protein
MQIWNQNRKKCKYELRSDLTQQFEVKTKFKYRTVLTIDIQVNPTFCLKFLLLMLPAYLFLLFESTYDGDFDESVLLFSQS